MFLLRKTRLFLQFSANSQNINFSQYRELRKFTKAVESLDVTSEDSYSASVTVQDDPSSRVQEVDPEKSRELVPGFPPTFNLAAYVNKSESLQQLLKLGVDLSKIEKRKGLPQFVLKLDFEQNIKPYLTFWNDFGISPECFGEMITKNPLVFKEDIDDLRTRINYLEVKNFKMTQIQRIITKNPFWLMFTTKRIDNRLGFFQRNFNLAGDDVRFLATKQPRLITYNMEHIRQSIFCIKEEMGFDNDEIKCLILNKPKLWMLKSNDLVERFDFVHRKMGLSHDMIMHFPEVLLSRKFRIQQRHAFLKMLGKAQYDPEKDLYVSPKTLVEGTDDEFVTKIAKTDIETYDMFLKTL